VAVRVAALQPLAHVFGHIHIKIDHALALAPPALGVGAAPAFSSAASPLSGAASPPVAATRFVQSSLGYPSERREGRVPSPASRLTPVFPPPDEPSPAPYW